MKKRLTLTLDTETQGKLTRLARKLSLETSTPWDSQESAVRCFNIGLTHSMDHYYPLPRTNKKKG